jgi:ADP-heptose:LPS heptosyltransferase
VLICPGSDSLKKRMSIEKWELFAGLLNEEGFGVVQAGRATERCVRGAYSVLGLTSVREMIGLMRRFDAVVTADNFAMHAAHVWNLPAVVLWGPTDPRVYGYSEQTHLQAQRPCEHAQGCIGPTRSAEYYADCPSATGSGPNGPKGRERCMDTFDVAAVHRAVRELLSRPSP